MTHWRRILLTGLLGLFWAVTGHAFEKVLAEVESDLVPSPVQYAVIAPDGFRAMKNLPLVLNLHGGGGSRRQLIQQAPLWEKLWQTKTIPPAVVVMPSVTRRGFYMNFRDGSERWEDFLVGPFIDHLRATYPVSSTRERTFVTGVSMGGMGALRMAFRHPDRFAAVAALEPGIEPVLRYEELEPKHRFWRSDELFEQAFGKPVDAEYWAANHPPAMAIARAQSLRDSGLKIYIEAGDEDQFWLYEGAEFLHQILWRERIRHEYHLVHGADHVGPSLTERTTEGIRFLFRTLDPWPKTWIMRVVERRLNRMKARIEGTDHYNEPP